ncbi:MAG: cysteine desulfurase family protein [Christensenellales bacterium]
MRMIYLDNAATTMVSPQVLDSMLRFYTKDYGNASGVHALARASRKAVEQARREVADAIGANANEVFFTGSGTESDNWAIKGVAEAARPGCHIVTSAVEHHAVLNTCLWLQQQGHPVTLVPVDSNGLVHPDDVRRAITPDTGLISVMAANNEVGTLQPVKEIGFIAREHGIPFHVDAVQAMGAVDVDVNAWQADLLSLSAHKFHGPKGVGALYVRSGTPIRPLLHGGAQETGRRAGTENVAGIVGMGTALRLTQENKEEAVPRVRALRDRLIEGILSSIPGAHLNGHQTLRLANNVNVYFDGVEGEALLLRLDLLGIAASSGAACTSGVLEPSHVLTAMGRTRAQARSAIRFSLSDGNTMDEIDQVLQVLPQLVADLRAH